MTLWPTPKPSSGELKLHRLWSLLVLVSVGLSAQVPLARPDLPSNKQVIAFMTESIDWYRHCAMKRQIAIDPVDLAFVDAHRQDAAQILQLSFDPKMHVFAPPILVFIQKETSGSRCRKLDGKPRCAGRNRRHPPRCDRCMLFDFMPGREERARRV
jgi:hypothetical protein